MAAALMAAALARRDCLLSVGSAGLVSEGVAPPRQVLDVMAPLGLDLSGHRSHLLRADDVGGADLVVGMTRQHVVDMAAMEPGLWTRCFTLVGLDKRARAVGPRLASELLSEWVARVQAGRTRTSVLSLPLADDIADPMGGRLRDFQRTRDLLISLTDALAEVVAPDHGPSPA